MLDPQEKHAVAYTISPSKGAMVAFDPELPATTVRVLGNIPKNGKVAGTAVKDSNYIYYLVDEYTWPELYRYDKTTRQSVNLGSLQVFIGNPSDMAYDPVNKLIYVVSGYYVFQFEEERLTPGGLNAYSGYLDVTKRQPLSRRHRRSPAKMAWFTLWSVIIQQECTGQMIN